MIKAVSNDNLRDEIINLALMQHHKPYEHGMHGTESFDCAGLVWYVYNTIFGIDVYQDGYGLSTTTRLMTSTYGTIIYYEENITNKDLSIINKGDILFFHRQSLDENAPSYDNKYPGHCGIYLGDNKFIHAPRKKGIIVIGDFSKREYWTRKLVASKDIVSNIKR